MLFVEAFIGEHKGEGNEKQDIDKTFMVWRWWRGVGDNPVLPITGRALLLSPFLLAACVKIQPIAYKLPRASAMLPVERASKPTFKRLGLVFVEDNLYIQSVIDNLG